MPLKDDVHKFVDTHIREIQVCTRVVFFVLLFFRVGGGGGFFSVITVWKIIMVMGAIFS